MKQALCWIVLLAAALSACNLPGVNLASPAAQAENTQAPAVDTAIAQLVLTQQAAPQTGPAYPEMPTAGAPPASLPAPTELLPGATAYPPLEGTPIPQATLPPTAPAGSVTLPAPLLFLSAQNESTQVWRLETDGKTLKQLTNEEADVTEFDVSPVDGRVAYVSGNDLYVINADGSGRTLIVEGPPAPPENDPNRQLLELGRPRWSPDGQNIAYKHAGVNLIPAAGGAPNRILASDPLPQPPDYKTTGPVYGYWPESWAPDGKRLLIGYSIWPEFGGLAILNATGGQPLMIQPVESFTCCNPVWTLDGSGILYANPFFGMILAGMWRSDANTGQSQTLIQGDPKDGTFLMPGFVNQASDGKLYFFYGMTNTFPEGDVMLTPVRSEPDGKTGLTPLRSDAWLVGEALWAPNGGSVVILDMAADPQSQAPIVGKLVYLKSDNSPAVTLPASGSMLHWGK